MKPLGHIFSISLFCGVSIYLYTTAPLTNPFSEWNDQICVNLMIEKEFNPEILSRDPFYAKELYKPYIPFFRKVISLLMSLFETDVCGVYRILIIPVALISLTSMYSLIFYLTKDRFSALFVSLLSLVVRDSLGGTYYGFSGFEYLQPRSLFAMFVPFFYLLFFLWKDSRKMALLTFLIGILSNIHPTSGLHLSQILLLSLLLYHRLKAIRKIVLCTFTFGIGILPFAFCYLTLRENLNFGINEELIEAILYRFHYLLYPLSHKRDILKMLFCILPLAVIAFYIRRELPERRLILLLILSPPILSFLPISLYNILAHFGIPYIDIMQLRALKYIYMPLYIALGFFTKHIISLYRTKGCGIAALLFFLLSFDCEDVGRILHISQKVDRPQRMYEWVRKNTDANALFLYPSALFRYETKRSITGSFKDGAYFILAGSKPYIEWYRRMKEIERCKTPERLLAIARRDGVDYIILENVSFVLPGCDLVYSDKTYAIFSLQQDRSH